MQSCIVQRPSNRSESNRNSYSSSPISFGPVPSHRPCGPYDRLSTNKILNLRISPPRPNDFERRFIDQSIKISRTSFHAISELTQKVFELEDSTKHVPVTATCELAFLELAEPTLNQNGGLVGTVTMVNGCQFDVELRGRTPLGVKFDGQTDYKKVESCLITYHYIQSDTAQ